MSIELIDALKAKDVLAVKRIIANDDEDGMLALLHTCELQSFALLKLLEVKGADVNHPNVQGHYAVDIAYWHCEFIWCSIPPRASVWWAI
ncbi:ankyrin repeat domain-containing protein [Shewanella sp.]|uniref:ankyrin repeat domain-containing protein n=1 Tax=Shewanella sp. TaxID=50422 RepID=UPI003A842961